MPINCEFLVVAGGGGGGSVHPGGHGGGGGAGGYQAGTYAAAYSFVHDVVIGGGGAGAAVGPGVGTAGGNSAIYYFTGWLLGGGYGGTGNNSGVAGGTGGSGGGGGNGSAAGAGTAGQGNNGGQGSFGSGGGGIGAAGSSGSVTTYGYGGVGAANAISGSSVYYAGGGGGGGGLNQGPSTGGAGGGGTGGWQVGGVPPTAGANYTGGGGGGGSVGAGEYGAAGGSGIAIIRYPGPQVCSGGSVSSVGGYTIHTFYGTGQFITPAPPVPTINTIDNTTTGAVNDAVVVQGTTAYTHIWGTNLLVNTYGTVSGAGVTAPFAAWSGDGALVALNITTAVDAAPGARSITVTNANGTSNAMTLTVVQAVPVITNIVHVGGAAGAVFQGLKARMIVTGSGFYGTVNFLGSSGVIVGNHVPGSTTQFTIDLTCSVDGAQTLAITTNGGTSNAFGVYVHAPVANPSLNPGMIINQLTGAAATGHPGPLGMQLHVASDRMVTHLGRWKFGTNNKPHVILLRDASWLEVARVTVDLAVGASDTWVYTPLPTPVKLLAGQYYFLSDMSCGSVSSDPWANVTQVAMDAYATSGGTIYEVASMYSFTRGTDRTDAYSLGYRFTATSAYVATALGRWKFPGNSLAHVVRLKDAAGTIIRSAVVDFTGGKGLTDQFNYVPVAPLTLTAGATYYVTSEEGGDVWPNNDTTVAPWGGLTFTGNCYDLLPVGNSIPTMGSTIANTMYTAPDILCVGQWPSGYAESYVTVNLKWVTAQQPMAMLI